MTTERREGRLGGGGAKGVRREVRSGQREQEERGNRREARNERQEAGDERWEERGEGNGRRVDG